MRPSDDAVDAVLTAAFPPLNGHDRVHFGRAEFDAEGKTVVTPTPYVVVHTRVGDDRSRRSSGESSLRDVPYRVVFVGVSQEQAIWAGQRVRDTLGDVVLTIAGVKRLCRYVDNPGPINRDNDSGRWLFAGSDEYAVSLPIAR